MALINTREFRKKLYNLMGNKSLYGDDIPPYKEENPFVTAKDINYINPRIKSDWSPSDNAMIVEQQLADKRKKTGVLADYEEEGMTAEDWQRNAEEQQAKRNNSSLDVSVPITTTQNDNSLLVVPPNNDYNNIVTKKNEGDGSAPSNESIIDELYKNSEKSIKDQEKYNKFSTILNAVTSGGAILGNLLAKAPRSIPAPVVRAPIYKSSLMENKNEIDRSMNSQLVSAIKVARETGRPELIQPMLANLLNAKNTAYNQIATNQIEQDNLQSVANANADNENEKNRYGAAVDYAKTLDDINLKRSELVGNMTKDLVSTIPNRYARNKASLMDSADKIKVYKWYLSQGGKVSFDDFNKHFFGQFYEDATTSKTNANTTETIDK